MSDVPYGSRPQYLPEFLRNPSVVGRIKLLDIADSRDAESLSLDRFDAASGDVLNWDGVHDREWWNYEDEAAGIALLRQLMAERAEHVTFLFWGNLGIPSVALPASAVAQYADAIVDAGPDFWLFLPDESALIEYRQDGLITAGPIPAARGK